jgi:glycine betaine/proline transport system substrate-binding protein
MVLLVGLVMLAAACGGDDGSGDSAASGGNRGEVETIKLAVNPWNGSAANVAVAAQLLESELGYTVEITEVDENAQWAAINTGDLHGSLEVWPSGHAENIVDFIDNGEVENAGLLGPVGKIGWYIPTYMVDQHPELATWEGFADPELAGLFASAETGDLGQFLGGDPSFVQYDEDIIANLGLSLQVVYAGSEEAILAAIDSAYSREEPVLVYLWTPHSAHNAYDLTEVALPDYSDECYEGAESGGVDCDYPADDLFKIVWSGLAEGAPDAHALLTNMSYTTEDQVAILASIETDGMTVEDAAAKWIADNEDTWRGWLPA